MCDSCSDHTQRKLDNHLWWERLLGCVELASVSKLIWQWTLLWYCWWLTCSCCQCRADQCRGSDWPEQRDCNNNREKYSRTLYLLNGFESQSISLELVCQTFRVGTELLRHIPDTRGKLMNGWNYLYLMNTTHLGPIEILHWSKVRTLSLLHLMTSDSNNKKDDSSYCRSHAGVFTLSDQISNWAEEIDQSHMIGGEDSHGWSYWLLRSCNHHSGRALSMREVRKCDACDESSGISTRSHF